MRKLSLRTALIASVIAMSTAAYAGDDISVSTGVDYVTDYVFRGVSLADTAIQPYAEVTAGSFTVGGWFSAAIGDTSVFAGDEFDLYASYSTSLSDKVGLDIGATYYHYPQGGSFFETQGGSAGSYEVSAGLSFDTPLSPSVTAYYDVTLEAFTIEGGVGHSFEFGPKSTFDLGGTAGYVDGDGFSYEYGQASASLGYGFTDTVSVYAGANFSVSSEDSLNFSKILQGDGRDSLLWIGTGISAGF